MGHGAWGMGHWQLSVIFYKENAENPSETATQLRFSYFRQGMKADRSIYAALKMLKYFNQYKI